MLCCAFNDRGTRAVCSGAVEKISQVQVLYESGSVEIIASADLPQRGINALSLRHDEALFASAGWDHRARLFSWKTCQPLAILKYHSEGINCIEFCSNGNLLATGGKDSKVALWNLY